jgi:hypothetical protein
MSGNIEYNGSIQNRYRGDLIHGNNNNYNINNTINNMRDNKKDVELDSYTKGIK